MRPLADLPHTVRRSILAVFTDIDDTLTTDGRLPADAYAALERLDAAGIRVAPITGRPAGWCDMIARFWPVAGVVGENGAFYFSYDRGARRMRRRFAELDEVRAANRERLAELGKTILAEVQGAAIAADQHYRESDLAVDFCEDVPPLPPEGIDRIVTLFQRAGATAKVSSIHVNGWFGDYDKLTMTRRFATEVLGLDLAANKHCFVYVGDSPNDAPMFEFFPHACGVANVRDFEARIPHLPAYLAEARGGAGFVEIAAALLEGR